MAEPLDPKAMVSIEEIAMSSMYEIEVLIELLTEKEVITNEELLGKIQEMMIGSDLALEWHHTKNIDLNPEDVTPYSKKKVWWICRRKGQGLVEVQQRP